MKRFGILPLILMTSGFICAQTTTEGAILGTATDPSSALIAGAKVTATNTATGITATTTTDARGNYRFSLLKPGTYTVSAESPGFEKLEMVGILLGVGDERRTDFHLKLGSTKQEVVVSSEAAQINTETSERGDVIESDQIEHLPLNNRQFLQLAALEPGSVSSNPKRGVYQSKGVDVSFNGGRFGFNSYYIDGAANTDPLYNGLEAVPSLDSISQFRVMTNMYSAQYGRAGGAVVTIVTKSGTNKFHGTAYDYLRNKVLDALPYFYTGARNQLANYLLNNYGGTIGGPVLKNKTFFFFSAELYHQAKPGQLFVAFAPTDAERHGDVSHSINPWTGQPDKLVNPYTGQPIPSNVLPASLISPIGQKIMDLWPRPNYSGDPFLNLRVFRGGVYTQKKFLGRVDHMISSKDNVSVTFDFDNYDNVQPDFSVYGDQDNGEHNKTLVGSWTHLFTERLANDFKTSYAWFFAGQQNVVNKNQCLSWGFFPGVNTSAATCGNYLYSIGYSYYTVGGENGPFSHWNNSYYAKDNLMWAKGKHSLAVGGEFTRDMYSWQYGNGFPGYFYGLLDGDPNYQSYYGVSGSTFTDLLMGLPNYMMFGLGPGTARMPMLRNVISAYIQDDWKVKPRLTLNLGLRYDYEQPFANTDNQFMTLDEKTGLPRYAAGAPQDLLKLVTFKYETGGPNRPFNPNPRNFSPRIGFALRPFGGDRTAIRGGYGMFYTTENAFTTSYDSWVAPFQGLIYSSPACPSCWPDNQTHFTTPDQQPYGLGYLTGSSPGYFQPNSTHYPTGYVQQWNLGIAHDIGNKWGADVAYVGSHGTNLNGIQTVNTYNPALYQKVLANGFYNFNINTKGFNSHYDSLQATLKKTSSHGLSMLASYTWSHALAQASNDSVLENVFQDINKNGLVVKKVWSNADFDVRHRLTVSAGYELPFGRGKALGNSWNTVVNGIFGGWRSNLIYTYQTGVPWTVYSSDLTLPDRICSGVLPRGKRSANQWFDYNCFPHHQPTTYINPTTGQSELINLEGNSPPDVIPGPPTNSVDYGMEKYVNISEGQTLQFRAEAFNLFNHPNWVGPGAAQQNYFFNSLSGSAITKARDGRDIQLSMRYRF